MISFAGPACDANTPPHHQPVGTDSHPVVLAAEDDHARLHGRAQHDLAGAIRGFRGVRQRIREHLREPRFIPDHEQQ
jgi:hypothetical protein